MKREGWIHRKETQEELFAWKIVKDETWRKLKPPEVMKTEGTTEGQNDSVKDVAPTSCGEIERRCDELHAMRKKRAGQNDVLPVEEHQNRESDMQQHYSIHAVRKWHLATKEEDIVDRWRRHFESLPNHVEMKAIPQALQQTTCSPVCEDLAKTPSLEETMTAMNMMEHCKATGEDGVPVELLRSSEYSVKHLHQLIVSVWESEEVPSIWRNVTISITIKIKATP